MSDPEKDREALFDRHVYPCPISGCFLWGGVITDKGYGRFCLRYKRLSAHRWAWERQNGPIPAGLVVDHLCRNRACVNPAHMRLVTNRENVLAGEGYSARNARKEVCPRCGGQYNFVGAEKERKCKACSRKSQVARIRRIGVTECKICGKRLLHMRAHLRVAHGGLNG